MADNGTLIKRPIQASTHLKDTRPEYNGRIWPWNRNLAVYPYMVPYNMPEETVAEETPEVAEAEVEAKQPKEPDLSRVPEIVGAMPYLMAGKDFVKNGAHVGKPTCTALTRILDCSKKPVTAAERDEAWAQHQASQKGPEE